MSYYLVILVGAVLVNNFVCPRSELLSNIEKLFVELFAAE